VARLHVLGDWHGPGEENAARRLAAELPEGWDIVAGRNVPDGMGTVDIDLIVVSPRAVYVLEEKSWGPHVVVDEVAWYVGGDRRHSPNTQVQHAAKVLAGRIKSRIRDWREIERAFPRGHRVVRGHILMSHRTLVLDGADRLGEDVVLRLDEAAATLQRLDATCPPALGARRRQLMEFLLGLNVRGPEAPPVHIYQYRVEGKPMRRGNAIVYGARTPAGELVDLCLVPVDNAADPKAAHKLATREHAALTALAAADRAWGVHPWFPWEGHVVTPVVVAPDGESLAKLIRSRRHVDESDRVPAEIGVPVVRDAFQALADVHAREITHRALRPASIEVTPQNRVRFRDFDRAHLPSTETIAPLLDDTHPSAAFHPPGVPIEMFRPEDDLYSLALSMVQWLYCDPTDKPDHDLARRRAAEYPEVGPVLARCLSLSPGETFSAAEAVAALTPQPPPAPPEPEVTPEPVDVLQEGALLGGRYRLLRVLGEGAWAVTWLAHDENLDERRTVKHLRPGRTTPEQVRAEYDNAAALRSFYCARMHDRLAKPEPGCLVQEYVPGETLHDLTNGRPPLEREQARRIAVDVLTGLADAHDRSIYHRDVSPHNIVVREDGQAVLIDFGLASRADAAQSAVGSPPYTAPEVWTRRTWSPAADIYSASAAVLHAMLGRLPYAGPGIDERRTFVPPTAEHLARYGQALLDVLYRGVAYDPSDRPSDARAFAEEVRRASDITPAAGSRRVVNPTVAALRGLYRHSRIGNAGNRGLDDVFAKDTYVPTRLDTELLPAIVRGELDVVVLSGNPGDGKTSFLVKVGEALDRAGAVTLHSDPAGWRRRLGNRTFAAVYDASESHGDLTSDELVERAFVGADEHTVLLAANDGRIAQFCVDHADVYPQVTTELERQRLGGAVPLGARIVLVDLKRRALAMPDPDEPSLGANVLRELTALYRWEVCRDCEVREVCPIRRNAEVLRAGQARRTVSELLLTSHLRRRRRATVRDVRSAFGWLITGDRSCEEVHDDVESGRDPRPGREAFDLAFDRSSRDYLVQEWAELDPAALPAPALARAARNNRALVPDLAGLDAATMTQLKRAALFGAWSVPGAEHEVRAYRHLPEFLAALAEPDKGLTRILLGVSRVLAFVGYQDEGHLALRDRVFDDPAVRSIVVIKELPAAEFRLAGLSGPAPFVESFPDQLELQHLPSGARLRITLDTAELLLRSADGEILGDTASEALRQEIQSFGDRLRLQPARTVRIVDGAGSSLVATATADGRIVREVAR